MNRTNTTLRRSRTRRSAVIVVAAGSMLVPSAAVAAPDVSANADPSVVTCTSRNNNSFRKLLDCVRLRGVRLHQAALQEIADANGGTRADQTPGFAASVDYVALTMKRAGWKVEVVPFEYDDTEATLDQLDPVAGSYPTGGFTGSGEGVVTGAVTAVDVNLVGDRASSSGCEVADFAGLDFSGPNDIALIQRGTCSFGIKAANAQTAGAEAVIIFNQGNSPDREGLIVGTLLPDGAAVTIPVVGASFAQGESLAQAGSTAVVSVDFLKRTSQNVIAELKGRNDANVVMAGAHLDSVAAGPGINDNGSGSAVLLEIAEQLGNHRPQNTLRFAWWGAEELGLLGSAAWVEQRSEAELAEIAMYMNFDMVGSPNHIFMVYDADESTFPAPAPVPEGSIAIEDTFESFYTAMGVPYDDTEFSGRSDYQAFIDNGIPSSGLFTGAEEIKTEAQAAIWGGTAGDAFDPCYHQACDTYDNNNDEALAVNADAIAFAVLTYAYSTESVNGVPGRTPPGAFTVPAPAGEEGTFTGEGGGGLHPDHGHDPAD